MNVRQRCYALHQSNFLCMALLSAAFYLLTQYSISPSLSFQFYKLIAVFTLMLALVLSEYKLLLVNNCLYSILYINNWPWCFLILSQCWLIVTLDLANGIHTIKEEYLSYGMFSLAILNMFSCFLSVLV